MAEKFVRFLRSLFCRHDFRAIEEIPGITKTKMTEPWSGESGAKIYNRFRCQCSKCEKKTERWLLTVSVGYGGMGINKYNPINSRGAVG
jgi:hypothetical protein